jgi:hypothetical protein
MHSIQLVSSKRIAWPRLSSRTACSLIRNQASSGERAAERDQEGEPGEEQGTKGEGTQKITEGSEGHDSGYSKIRGSEVGRWDMEKGVTWLWCWAGCGGLRDVGLLPVPGKPTADQSGQKLRWSPPLPCVRVSMRASYRGGCAAKATPDSDGGGYERQDGLPEG